MTTITINGLQALSSDMRELAQALGPARKELNEVGGRFATEAATKYHRDYDTAGRWRSATGLKGGEPSGFGATVSRAWFLQATDADGTSISNAAPNYAFKVSGGTIVPKRVKFLTIPMVPEAKGRRAADYEIRFSRRLFTIPGRNALFEQTGNQATESVRTRTYGRRRGGQRVQISARGGIRPVYALVKSVTQSPWPGALPPDDVIIPAFVRGWNEALSRLLQ